MHGLLGLWAISLILITTITGCRPSGPSEDMGTVVNEMPAVDGTEEPYVIPELGPTTEEAKEGEGPKPVVDAKPVKEDMPAHLEKPAGKH